MSKATARGAPDASGLSRWFGAPPRVALARAVRVAVVFAGATPLLVAWLRSAPVIGILITPIEAWFEFQCHRDPLRSIQLLGRVLPVCTRCLGIYSGLGLGALLLWPKLGAWPLRIWVGLAALAMVVDVWTEAWGLHSAHTEVRLMTGLMLAYPVGATLVWAAREG